MEVIDMGKWWIIGSLWLTFQFQEKARIVSTHCVISPNIHFQISWDKLIWKVSVKWRGTWADLMKSLGDYARQKTVSLHVPAKLDCPICFSWVKSGPWSNTVSLYCIPVSVCGRLGFPKYVQTQWLRESENITDSKEIRGRDLDFIVKSQLLLFTLYREEWISSVIAGAWFPDISN